MNSNAQILLFALQTAKDSPAALTAAHYIGAYDVSVNHYEGEKRSNNLLKPHDGHDDEYNVNPHMSLSFKVDIPMMVTPGVNTPPLVGDLLVNSGHEENIVTDAGSEKVTYTLINSLQYGSVPYASYEYYHGNIKYRLDNVLATLNNVEVSPLGFVTLSFNVMADYTKPEHVETLPVVDKGPWETLLPVTDANTPVMKFYTRNCVLKSLSMSPNLSIAYENYTNSRGVRFQGGTRKPTMSLGIRAETLDDWDAYAAAETHGGTSTEDVLEFQHGTTSGDNFGMLFPAVQITDIQTADGDGDIDFNFSANAKSTAAGNDDYMFVFNKFIA